MTLVAACRHFRTLLARARVRCSPVMMFVVMHMVKMLTCCLSHIIALRYSWLSSDGGGGGFCLCRHSRGFARGGDLAAVARCAVVKKRGSFLDDSFSRGSAGGQALAEFAGSFNRLRPPPVNLLRIGGNYRSARAVG